MELPSISAKPFVPTAARRLPKAGDQREGNIGGYGKIKGMDFIFEIESWLLV
jgi:hypothetical protein|nr:hypothetical protein [uncultured Oscillibacter sp.]